jgi:sugar lactone lactonase YvrE
MANDKDFVLKNALEVGKDTKVTLGTITSSDLDLSTGNYFAETLATDTTYTLSNAGSVQSFQLEVTGGETVAYLDGSAYANKLKFVGAEDTNPFGLTFSTDGTKMYIGGVSGEDINQYSLSTAWDVSTATYDSNFITNPQAQQPRGVAFKSDGTEMYVLLSSTDGIYQYSLSTAWDISTASYASKSLIVTSQDTTPEGIAFSVDGTKLYMCGATSDRIHQYTLSTAWDLATASYASKSFLLTGQFTNPTGISFSSDGSVVIALGDTSAVAYQYSLSTPWDISTASYSEFSLDFSSQATSAKDIFLGDNDTSFYILATVNVISGGANDSVYQFNCGATPYTITWPASVQWSGGTAPSSPEVGETDVYTFITDDGGTSYVGIQSADNLS